MSGSVPTCLALTCLCASFAVAHSATAQDTTQVPIDEIVVWGNLLGRPASSTQPATVITQEDLLAVNVQTTEDIVKYEPGVIIRRRFIGDTNGTLGMRGSNMFQTSRSLVFADGVPLHYLLQSRWNGAPRWSMIAASEMARVDVLYGPFSAEYSGNAMGGVILIESSIPQEREIHVDTSLFSQHFDAYGFDGTLNGKRAFFSYGDKLDDLSLYFSVNRLENESQPQSFYYAAPATGSAVRVMGGILEPDDRGRQQLWFGDSGVVDTVTHHFKLKAAYAINDWVGLFNVAYEDRDESGSPNTYLRDASGSPVWGGVFEQGQVAFAPPARFGTSRQKRDSLSIGFRIKGPLTQSIELESNLNRFAILGDRIHSSRRNPRDPRYTAAAQLTDFGESGWTTGEVKLYIDTSRDDVRVSTGLRHEIYQLNINVLDSDASGMRRFAARSGGETTLAAAFLQGEWDISERFTATVGGRYERFSSNDGYYSQDDQATATFDLVQVERQQQTAFSPKLSLLFQPDARWSFHYAIAEAWRFPIVEELFSQYEAYNAINEANPGLQPERGLHHSFTIERQVAAGYLRLNLFHERINDVIEAQSTALPGGQSLRTFIPIDEVVTSGADLIFNARELFDQLDVRFNVTYTDSEIVRNPVQPVLEGNRYPRMPNWRSNLLLTWHFTDASNTAVNYQYADNSYGQLDNSDRQANVFGAQDGYSRIGLKSNYVIGNGFTVSVGVDNITDEIAYVTHPWPGRTVYLDLRWTM